MPLFRGSSRFESLILSHHSRFNVTRECNKEEINDDDEQVVGSLRTKVARIERVHSDPTRRAPTGRGALTLNLHLKS